MKATTGVAGNIVASHFWLIVAVAFAVYLPSFAGVFQFDDYNVIVNYPTVHSWQTLVERASGGVRAVLKASYTLNWTLGSGEFGFHLFNNAVHALNAALLYVIGVRLCARWFGAGEAPRYTDAALAAALLFAFHPAQTEAVTYISGRSSSLMAGFYLGALLVYLRGGHWAITLLLFVLAAATRETAVTLPAALLLCELCTRKPIDWRGIARRQGAYWLLLILGAIAVMLLSARYFDLLSFGFTRRGVADNLLTQVGGVSYLVWRLIGLHGYNIDPALPALHEWTAMLAQQAALFALLFALGAANLRRRPWIAFGVLWFFVQLAPTNSIVPRLDVANDRQLYLACWGLFFALCVQIASLELPRRALVPIAVATLTLFAIVNVTRQRDYASEIALWESSVTEAPWNARARNNLGYAYYLAGRKKEARLEFETALFLDRSYAKARLNYLLLDWQR